MIYVDMRCVPGQVYPAGVPGPSELLYTPPGTSELLYTTRVPPAGYTPPGYLLLGIHHPRTLRTVIYPPEDPQNCYVPTRVPPAVYTHPGTFCWIYPPEDPQNSGKYTRGPSEQQYIPSPAPPAAVYTQPCSSCCISLPGPSERS